MFQEKFDSSFHDAMTVALPPTSGVIVTALLLKDVVVVIPPLIADGSRVVAEWAVMTARLNTVKIGFTGSSVFQFFWVPDDVSVQKLCAWAKEIALGHSNLQYVVII